MRLASTVFNEGDYIPAQYTCDGKNFNPRLEISDVPSEAVSLALIMDDPDAPGGGWVHWLVWNIDPTTTAIPDNSLPEGATQGLTSFGRNEYGGPCPPKGTHRYFFKLYALSKPLDIPPDTGKEELLAAIKYYILEEASLMGLYKRQ